MRKLAFSFSTSVDFSVPVREHAFALRCLPTTRPGQAVQAQLVLEPETPFALQYDAFGNSVAIGRIDEEHSRFAYCAKGTAEVQEPCYPLLSATDASGCPEVANASIEHCAQGSELFSTPVRFEAGKSRNAHPMFRFDSPLAFIDPALTAFAEKNSYRQGAAANLAAGEVCNEALRLTQLVNATLAYDPGSTTVNTNAAQAFAQSAGVCQDFAHVMCTILRYWGVAARYVSGLTIGEGASHAWTEAFIDGTWLGFDPTRNRLVDSTYLTIAVGRDWSDCPIERGVFKGAADQLQTVFMEVSEQ